MKEKIREIFIQNKEFQNDYMEAQIKRLIIVNIAALIYGFIGYFWIVNITFNNPVNGHIEYKSLVYVALTMLAYLGVGNYFVTGKKRNTVFQIGTMLCAQLYMVWALQAIYFSIIENRFPNVILWLLVMTVCSSIFLYPIYQYIIFFILNVVLMVMMLKYTEHVDIGDSTLTNLQIFGLIITFIYYARYFSNLAAFEARRKIEKAAETRQLFSASMNHELRAPLNSIIGNTQILLMDERVPGPERETLENIFNSSKNMVQLVNELLDFSRLEAGEFKITPVEFELTDLSDNLKAMFINLAKEKKLEYKIEIEEGTPLNLYGDVTRMQQIAVNIISNAVKYTQSGTVAVDISVEQSNLIIKVKDTGIGMPPDTINDLFSPFKRINERANSNIQGTGLGMFIVKNLLEQMEGQIRVESEVGIGSTFTVKIPVSVRYPGKLYTKVVEQKAEVEEYADGKINGNPYDFTGKTILSVDDTVMNNRIIQNLLESTGAKVYCMLDAERCLKYLMKNTADLILLDHMMPGMNGVECLGKIRQGDESIRNIPVIMLTGNGGEKFAQLYKETGANGYLSKPIMQDKLMKIIKETMA